MKNKVIADIEASFENRKSNLSFDVQNGTAYIYLVADGLQVADVAKLLLLKGKDKSFGVRFYEKEKKRQASPIPESRGLTRKNKRIF